MAIFNPPMLMRPGADRARWRIDLVRSPGSGSSLLELDVVAAPDLEQRFEGPWAWLDLELRHEVKEAQFRFWAMPDAVVLVSDMRLERRVFRP